VHRPEIKYKVDGLFSTVAKKTNYNAADVSTVYSWYVENVVNELHTKPVCQVYLKNFGVLKYNAIIGLKNLTGQVYGLEGTLNAFLNGEKLKVRYSYLVKRHKELSDALGPFEERLEKLTKLGIYKETYYLNKIAGLERLKKHLNQLYESIQRIPEDQQKRTAERGQDLVWTDEQSSRPF
jgi:hypothetical protein